VAKQPGDGYLRLTVVAMALGLWFMVTAVLLLVWHYTAGGVPPVLVKIVIGVGIVSTAVILVSVALGALPPRRQPPKD